MTSKEDEKQLSIETFHIQVGYLEGKILTIADASFIDKEQRSAFKSLVKKMFREQRNHVDQIVYGYSGNVSSKGAERVYVDPTSDK